jgi:hypothetical protein
MTDRELLELLHEDVGELRRDVANLKLSVTGCQAASSARQAIAAQAPSKFSALAAWLALAVAVAAHLFR